MPVILRANVVFVAALLCGALQLHAQSPSPSTVRAFVGAKLIDVATGRITENAVIVVRDGQIDAVGPAERVTPPAGADVVDLGGRYVIPGLITSHAHVSDVQGIGPRAYTETNTRRQLGVFARYGVTTVWSLGGEQEPAFQVRAAQRSRSVNTARIYLSGEVVVAKTPEEARQAVARVAASKPDIVKIRVDDNLGTTAKMAPEVYRAVIDESHRRKLRVAAHIFYLDDAKDLLRAGVDMIAHSVRDREIDEEFIALMKQRDIPYCPTLTRELSTFVYEATPAFFSDPFFVRDADPAVVSQLQEPARQQAMRTSKSARAYKAALGVAKKNLKKAADAGLTIVMGTDAGPFPERFPGYFEHLEMEMMADTGLAPAQIVRSATVDAARAMGLEHAGAVVRGAWADLVVLDRNPLTDIRNTRSIASVWIGGREVASAKGWTGTSSAERPFGTLRQQAAVQQEWLRTRVDTFVAPLMRRHGIDMWVVPMREYNEDPVFVALTAPETFAARRRTIYVFFDTCAAAGTPPAASCVQRIALGGTSQGGVFEPRRSTAKAAGDVGRGQQAELWGDEQWQVLKDVIEERSPRVIGINRSSVFAFSDGLSSGELQGMSAALGSKWTSRFKNAEGLPLELIASRLPEEEAFFKKMQELVWSLTQEMFSSKVITAGTTRTSDLVWWWRQRVNDLGLGTWFQPSVDVQRRGATADQIGADPVIQHGDLLHCDVGITVARLNTDTQHLAYVLRPGESDAPEGLRRALANANALQDIVIEEIRPGRTGNEILAASRARMKARAIDGTVYSHPIGLHGHGAGPLIGLWDYQDGVPGRGDATVIPSMWWSIELQATTPVPEWDGQQVRMAQEEDAIIPADGKIRWALRRQDNLFLIR
jgi:imidazolonepropionase-like amidohydrolase/Xaa-Pro aminopeptidase